MKPTEPYATSVVAMSIYNWIAASGLVYDDLDHVQEALEAGPHPDLTDELFQRAADELIARKLLIKRSGYFDIVDTKRRIFVSRDRSDFFTNVETGEIEGGWASWARFDPVRGVAVL
jgi:hypothetical protein